MNVIALLVLRSVAALTHRSVTGWHALHHTHRMASETRYTIEICRTCTALDIRVDLGVRADPARFAGWEYSMRLNITSQDMINGYETFSRDTLGVR